MRQITFTFCIIVTIASSISCNKTVTCFSPYVDQIAFYPAAPTDSITDSIASLEKYVKGSSFTQQADTFPFVNIQSAITGRQKTIYIPNSQPYSSNQTYTYDLRVRLSPSGKVYDITNITAADRSLQGDLNVSSCSDVVTYMVNDSSYAIQGMSGKNLSGDAAMMVKY